MSVALLQVCASLFSALLLPLDAASQHPALLRRHAPLLCLHLLPHTADLYQQLAEATANTGLGTQPGVSSGNKESDTRSSPGSECSSDQAADLVVGDAQFMCAKLLCDYLPLLLLPAGEAITDTGQAEKGQGEQGEEDDVGQLVADLVHHHLLPLYPLLLSDCEPLPAYAERLLVLLLDHAVVAMADLAEGPGQAIAVRCFQRLTSDPSLVSMHTLRLGLLLITHPAMAPLVAQEQHLLPRVAALLDHVCASDMPEYVDPVLSLCLLLLEMAVGPVRPTEAAGARASWTDVQRSRKVEVGVSVEAVVQHCGVFLRLCGYQDPLVADMAADCMNIMLSVLQWQVARILLPSMQQILSLLQTSTGRQNVEVQEKVDIVLLRVVTAAAAVSLDLLTCHGIMNELPHDILRELVGVVEEKVGSRSNNIAQAAKVAHCALQKLGWT